MENKIEDKAALKEAYIVLNELKLYDKISPELKELIESNMDNNHIFAFDKNMPLFNQISNVVTRNILTYVYTTYINKSNDSDNYFTDLNYLK